jgi:hypothetical protein
MSSNQLYLSDMLILIQHKFMAMKLKWGPLGLEQGKKGKKSGLPRKFGWRTMGD